jgi:hypothetical protein
MHRNDYYQLFSFLSGIGKQTFVKMRKTNNKTKIERKKIWFYVYS